NWCATDDVEVSPTASPISRMLGGYPRSVTEVRITSRMMRWRSVSVVSRWPVSAVSLLSLIGTNVALQPQILKHLFETCRGEPATPGRGVAVGGCRWLSVAGPRLRQQFDHVFVQSNG